MPEVKFDSSKKIIPHFLKELKERTEAVLKENAQHMITTLSTQDHPHLERSIIFPYPENRTYNQTAADFERELEFIHLKT